MAEDHPSVSWYPLPFLFFESIALYFKLERKYLMLTFLLQIFTRESSNKNIKVFILYINGIIYV